MTQESDSGPVQGFGNSAETPDDPHAIPRDTLQAWWHETIDIMFNDGLTPIRIICDNASRNRISIAYMTPAPEWTPSLPDDTAIYADELPHWKHGDEPDPWSGG